MVTPADDDIAAQQREVQRLLGRCLLRVQQYERLLKSLLAHREIAGSLHTLEINLADRMRETSQRTLGALAQELFGSFLFSSERSEPERGSEEDASFAVRCQIQLDDADYAAQREEMKQFVSLRNRLVHCFIDDHDLGSIDGCRIAQQALIDSYVSIDSQMQRLGDWANDLHRARRIVVAHMETEAFADMFVDCIFPDGTVYWPGSSIVEAFRGAALELGRDGWTRVSEASAWIMLHYPRQVPTRYGCRSWRHTLHESGLFELQRREVDGQRSIYYRERIDTSSPPAEGVKAISA
jgi:hypothetical protein